MFTGLVEEIGIVKNIQSANYGKRFAVEANKIFDDLKLGDSVAINGVCQTVVDIKMNIFSFDAVAETLKKTTLNNLSISNKVNLERALRLGSRLGGHIVQGHVDTCGTIMQINKTQKSAEIQINFPARYRQYLATTGSICIDGISLTTAEIFENSFKIAIIPTTLSETIIDTYRVGTIVNLEFDILGKYVESILKSNQKKASLTNFIDQPDFF